MTNLKPYLYTPKTDNALDTDFAQALRCHTVRAGQTNIFWKARMRWCTVPYSRVRRIFRRVLEAQGRLCCGGHHYLMEWLVLILDDGTELELYVGDGVEKDTVALLASLKEQHPEILYTKP